MNAGRSGSNQQPAVHACAYQAGVPCWKEPQVLPFWVVAHGPRLCWRLAENSPETVVLAAIGEIDMATAPEIDVALEPFADTAATIVLDVRDVTFIDCFGLRSLQRARLRNPRFTLRSPGYPVLRLLSLVHPSAFEEWIEDTKLD
jgi:anti-anti-sigma factor